jgi:hypothetical protein
MIETLMNFGSTVYNGKNTASIPPKAGEPEF